MQDLNLCTEQIDQILPHIPETYSIDSFLHSATIIILASAFIISLLESDEKC